MRFVHILQINRGRGVSGVQNPRAKTRSPTCETPEKILGDSEGIVVVDGYCGYNHVCTPEREDISRCETIGDRVRELANPISRLSAGRFYRLALPDRLYGRVRLDALVSGDELGVEPAGECDDHPVGGVGVEGAGERYGLESARMGSTQ
jgi:hypothetical protein